MENIFFRQLPTLFSNFCKLIRLVKNLTKTVKQLTAKVRMQCVILNLFNGIVDIDFILFIGHYFFVSKYAVCSYFYKIFEAFKAVQPKTIMPSVSIINVKRNIVYKIVTCQTN